MHLKTLFKLKFIRFYLISKLPLAESIPEYAIPQQTFVGLEDVFKTTSA